MKKLLAILLACAVLLSLAACDIGKVNENTKDEVQTTTPTNNKPNTKPDDKPNANPNTNKQEYYENYFSSEEFKMAGNSFKLDTDTLAMSFVVDANGVEMMELSVEDACLRIYKISADEQYVYVSIPNQDGFEDCWAKYEDESSPDAIEDSEMSTDIADINTENIVKVEYVETKDGFDILNVYAKNPEYDEDNCVTEYEIEFMYENQKCTMTVMQSISEGMVALSHMNKVCPDSFSPTDYDFDFETNVMTHEDDENQTIDFKVLSKTDKSETNENIMKVFVDASTHEVTIIETEYDGAKASIEFMDIASCTKDIDFTEATTVCDSATLGMLLLAVMFSAMS